MQVALTFQGDANGPQLWRCEWQQGAEWQEPAGSCPWGEARDLWEVRLLVGRLREGARWQ